MINVYLKYFILILSILSITSCIKRDLYEGEPNENPSDGKEDPEVPQQTETYIYPFNKESQSPTAEITIQTNSSIDPNSVKTEIPYLKYNKSLLVLLTQDDCKQSTYCRTWAAIHGRPISNSDLYLDGKRRVELYYDEDQYKKKDLPPNVYYLNKTLGGTDGAGNEVRFSITTTLSPENSYMRVKPTIKPNYTEDFTRFFMKSGLIWSNVIEMVNYGTGIAFHDVEASDVNDASDLLKHFNIAQDTILYRLSGRGCKFLAEPNGNKAYITAGTMYTHIQTMTAQAEAIKLYPFQVKDDQYKKVLEREFRDENPDYFKNRIEQQLALPVKERTAIAIGVHNTGNNWVQFLEWLNNTHGKDGDDVVWFPSQEEYYEYNYYRTYSKITKIVNGNSLKLNISLPSKGYSYYPCLMPPRTRG